MRVLLHEDGSDAVLRMSPCNQQGGLGTEAHTSNSVESSQRRILASASRT